MRHKLLRSPLAHYHDKPSSLAHLRVFGSACMVHLPVIKRPHKKGGHTSKAGIFIGYDPQFPSRYVVWLPDTNKIWTGTSVYFNENLRSLLPARLDRAGVPTNDPELNTPGSDSSDDPDTDVPDLSRDVVDVDLSSSAPPASPASSPIVRRGGASKDEQKDPDPDYDADEIQVISPPPSAAPPALSISDDTSGFDSSSDSPSDDSNT